MGKKLPIIPSIISWTQTLKKQTILTDAFLQNLSPFLTAVPYLIHNNRQAFLILFQWESYIKSCQFS